MQSLELNGLLMLFWDFWLIYSVGPRCVPCIDRMHNAPSARNLESYAFFGEGCGYACAQVLWACKHVLTKIMRRRIELAAVLLDNKSLDCNIAISCGCPQFANISNYAQCTLMPVENAYKGHRSQLFGMVYPATPSPDRSKSQQLDFDGEPLRPTSQNRKRFCLTLRNIPSMALDSPMRSPIGLHFDQPPYERPSTKGQGFVLTPTEFRGPSAMTPSEPLFRRARDQR